MNIMLNSTFTCAALLLLSLAAAPGHAHHSSRGIFSEEMTEIRGVVKAVRWRNPHVSYTVTVTDEEGREVDWYVETASVSTLRLRGIDQDFMQVGDRVHLAGLSSLRGRPELFAQNRLLDDGREALLRAVATPYWPAGRAGNLYRPEADESQLAVARRAAEGIFRVWSPVFEDPEAYPLYEDDVGPLTPAGAALKAQWDPRSSPYIGCEPKGMPHIMGSAYGIEFVEQGGDILVRLEEFDTERLIRMRPRPASEPVTYSFLGTSWGRWEDGTLVVETAGIDTPYFFGDGTPQSRSIRLTEYFTINEAEDRLDYRLVVDDPETFAETLTFTRYWIWRPEVTIEPYNCVE